MASRGATRPLSAPPKSSVQPPTLALGGLADANAAIVRRIGELQEQLDMQGKGSSLSDYGELLSRVRELERRADEDQAEPPRQDRAESPWQDGDAAEVLRRVGALEAALDEQRLALDEQRLEQRSLSETAELTQAELARAADLAATAQESGQRAGDEISGLRREQDDLRVAVASSLAPSPEEPGACAARPDDDKGAGDGPQYVSQLEDACAALGERMEGIFGGRMEEMRALFDAALERQASALQSQLAEVEQRLAPRVDELVQQWDEHRWAETRANTRPRGEGEEDSRIDELEGRVQCAEGTVISCGAHLDLLDARLRTTLGQMTGTFDDLYNRTTSEMNRGIEKIECIVLDVREEMEDFNARLEELRRQQDGRDADIALALRVGKTMDAKIQALDSMRADMRSVTEDILNQNNNSALSTTRCMTCATPSRPKSAGRVSARSAMAGAQRSARRLQTTEATFVEGGSPLPKRVVSIAASPQPNEDAGMISPAWRESVWHSIARLQETGGSSRPTSAKPIEVKDLAAVHWDDLEDQQAFARLGAVGGALNACRTPAGAGSRASSRPHTARSRFVRQ